jgi:hypothetical protein
MARARAEGGAVMPRRGTPAVDRLTHRLIGKSHLLIHSSHGV